MPLTIKDFHDKDVGDDGQRTTPHTEHEIEEALIEAGFKPIASHKQRRDREQNIDSLVMVWEHGTDKQ